LAPTGDVFFSYFSWTKYIILLVRSDFSFKENEISISVWKLDPNEISISVWKLDPNYTPH
jgi:hypothetical protein